MKHQKDNDTIILIEQICPVIVKWMGIWQTYKLSFYEPNPISSRAEAIGSNSGTVISITYS